MLRGLLSDYIVTGEVVASLCPVPALRLPEVVCAVLPVAALLFSICVRMSFVYFKRFVISALLLSNAWFKGKVDRSPFLLTYVTSLDSEFRRISVWS